MFFHSTIKPEEPVHYPVLPKKIEINPFLRFSSDLEILVHENELVESGAVIAKGTNHVVHTSIPGKVTHVSPSKITIENFCDKISWVETFKKNRFNSNRFSAYEDYLKEIVLFLIGGALLPASFKIKSAVNCHTLIINAV